MYHSPILQITKSSFNTIHRVYEIMKLDYHHQIFLYYSKQLQKVNVCDLARFSDIADMELSLEGPCFC